MFLFSEFPPVEPYLTTFNLLILLSAILVLVFWTSIYSLIPKEKDFFSLLSVLFMVAFTTLTSINRFVALTVVRQSATSVNNEILSLFLPYSWPSIMLALEILGWGVFFGIGCISLSVFFLEDKFHVLAYSLLVTGIFSVLSAVGQVVNSFLLSLLGLIAWGPLFTLTIFLLLKWLKTNQGPHSRTE
jgi:hypothetical protein